MTAGFPEGTPLRRASNFTYNHFVPVQFLRTTYKAGPLVVIGLAVLAGLGAARVPRRAWLIPALVLPLVASWPLIRGRAVDDQLLWDAHPRRLAGRGRPRRRAAATAAPSSCPASSTPTTTGAGRSTRSCPCSPTSRWRPATPSATPTCARPTCCGRSTRSSSSAARCPSQLDPLLDLLGARTVLAGADDDRTRSGAAPAAEAADVLDQLGRPTPRGARRAAAARGRDARRAASRCRRSAPGTARTRRASCASSGPSRDVVVDGSAEGLAALAPFERFERTSPTRATSRPTQIRAARRGRDHRLQPAARARPLAAGAERRAGARGGRGAVGRRRAAEPVPARRTRRPSRSTTGSPRVRAPSSPGFPQFPEHRPFAALDGDEATHWQADRALTRDRHVLEVVFDAPRDVATLELLPVQRPRVDGHRGRRQRDDAIRCARAGTRCRSG